LDESADLGGVLAAGRAFESRAGVDAPRAGFANGLGHVVGRETAGQNDLAGQAEYHAPIEGAAGSAALGTGGGVDEKCLGATRSERGAQVVFETGSGRKRLPETERQRRHRTVDLSQIQARGANGFRDFHRVRIHEDADFHRVCAEFGRDCCGGLRRDVARTTGPEIETERVGARRDGHLGVLQAGDAADLDENTVHAVPVIFR
jgi:hypothetical protein